MANKANYELKAQVIGNGCAKIQRKFMLSDWKKRQLEEKIDKLELEQEKLGIDNSDLLNDLEKQYNKIQSFYTMYNDKLKDYSSKEIKEAEKVNYASYKRTKRLKDKIYDMLKNKNAIFLTLTFKDSVLNSTTESTRKDYVRKFLKSQCSCYVANIDYGKKNEREHYHALVIPLNDIIDGTSYREKCGSIDFERVWHKKNENDFEKSAVRIAKYVNKLTNHAIKETTKQSRIIYSRN